MAVSFKGTHFPPKVILMGLRWYLAYPLSTRHVEELLEERGVNVDHSTINRWVMKYSPQLEAEFHLALAPGMDELAYGRDLYPRQGQVESSLPGR